MSSERREVEFFKDGSVGITIEEGANYIALDYEVVVDLYETAKKVKDDTKICGGKDENNLSFDFPMFGMPNQTRNTN